MDLFFFPYFCNPSPSCISAAVDKSLNNICDPLNVNISGSDTEFSGWIKIDFDLNYLVGIRVCLFFFINFQNLFQGKLMSCPFTGPIMFCASPNFSSQPNNLTAFSASSKTFVPAQNQFYWMQNIFMSGTKCLWLAQYVNKFLVRHKKCGPTQNILGPVEGQGIKEAMKMFVLETRYECIQLRGN